MHSATPRGYSIRVGVGVKRICPVYQWTRKTSLCPVPDDNLWDEAYSYCSSAMTNGPRAPADQRLVTERRSRVPAWQCGDSPLVTTKSYFRFVVLPRGGSFVPRTNTPSIRQL